MIKDLVSDFVRQAPPYNFGLGEPVKSLRPGITEIYEMNKNENPFGISPLAAAEMKKQVDIETEKKAIQEPSLAQDIIQLLLKIVIIIFAIILIFTFLYGIVRINDVSMKPAIEDGDLVMYYRLDKRFVSGDVAVFEDNGRHTTGRVVAVAGDTVDITKDGLKINGADQVSQDIYFDTTQFKDGVDFPITVGEGQVFILGDNRPQASDSRTFGCIDLNDVKGKVIAVIRTRGI